MLITEPELNQFRNDSVLHLKKLVDPSLCIQVKNYFLENEKEIIELYSPSKKGLVVEDIQGSQFIKYFEYPLHFNAKVFGALLNSDVFSLGQHIIGQSVKFVSAEIHSRYSGASKIPAHQDNAYYGLSNGDALTFYISLDYQSPSSGGLQYISNPISHEHEHIGSDSAAFSLALSNPQKFINRKIISPSYSPGDCTIHHSRSIHFADSSPAHSDRAIVFRITLYSALDSIKPNHLAWYSQMIAANRTLRS